MIFGRRYEWVLWYIWTESLLYAEPGVVKTYDGVEVMS